MSTISQEIIQEEIHHQRGRISAIIFLVIAITFFLLPFLSKMNPPPGQEGILVSFGAPDQGMGEEQPYAPEDNTEPSEETPDEVEIASDPDPQPEETEPEETVKETTPTKEVLTNNDAEIKLKKEKERQKKEEARKAAERKKREDKKKADEAKRKAEQEAAAKAAAAKKPKAGSLFGNKTSTGQGNTGKPGDQGDPTGDPNSGNLEGVNSGKGDKDVGGGLAGRGVMEKPTVTDNSQNTGIVVVKVCVSSSGSVVSASFTQRGSTTSNSALVAKSITAAKKYKFSKSGSSKQCGTIKFNYNVQ